MKNETGICITLGENRSSLTKKYIMIAFAAYWAVLVIAK